MIKQDKTSRKTIFDFSEQSKSGAFLELIEQILLSPLPLSKVKWSARNVSRASELLAHAFVEISRASELLAHAFVSYLVINWLVSWLVR